MTTNPQPQSINSNVCLHMSIELAATSWKLGFADQLGRNPRVRSFHQSRAAHEGARTQVAPQARPPLSKRWEPRRRGFSLSCRSLPPHPNAVNDFESVFFVL